MNKDYESLKAGFWYTIINFIIGGIGFFTTPIFSRLLSKNEFGLYNNFTSCLSLFTICLTLYLESTFISAVHDFKKDFEKYIFSILFLTTIIVFFFSIIFNVLFKYVNSFFGLNRFELNIILIQILFIPAINMYIERERYRYKYKKAILVSSVWAVGSILLSVLLAFTMKDKLYGRIVGESIIPIILGILLYLEHFFKGRKINASYWTYALKICIPFVPHLLSLRVLSISDRIMINKICGAEYNAFYSIACSCASVALILTGALNSAFAPWLGDKMHEKDYNHINSTSRSYILIYLLIVIILLFVSPELLFFLGGESYYSARFLVPPLVGGCVFQFLYTLYVNVEQFNKKTIGMAFASVFAATINLVLNYYLIPIFGFEVASYTTLLGYLILLIMHMILVKTYGYNRIFSNIFVICISLVNVFLVGLFVILYNFNTLRYVLLSILVLIYILLFIFFGNKIKGLLFILLNKNNN